MNFEFSLSVFVAATVVSAAIGVAGFVGSAAWHAGERQAAYKAYTDCLHEMRGERTEIQQTFCGKLRDQL